MCWTDLKKRSHCLKGTLDGYAWDQDTSDLLSVKRTGMAPATTFRWKVNSRVVATKTIHLPKR